MVCPRQCPGLWGKVNRGDLHKAPPLPLGALQLCTDTGFGHRELSQASELRAGSICCGPGPMPCAPFASLLIPPHTGGWYLGPHY